MHRPNEPYLRHVAATVHGRYLVRPPTPSTGAPRWLVGFHGYAQSAGIFLESLSAIPTSPEWGLVSVQALHPFYTGRGNIVVANWMTREDRDLAIADNIAYVDAVVDGVVAEHGEPASLVYAGFSQGVAMAYRAGLAGRRPCGAILAAGGDLPPEFHTATVGTWPRIVACTGNGDAFYTPSHLERDVDILRSRGAHVEAVAFDGGHEWSPEVVAAAARLLGEITPTSR